MASLWMEMKTKLFTMIQKPSPNANLFMTNSTRNSQKLSRKNILNQSKFIEKLSLFIPCRKKTISGTRYFRASMTVEASIVVPLCIFFLLNFGYAIEMVRLHNNIQLALTVVGEKAALYGAVMQDGTAESVLTGSYVREAVIKCAGKRYLDSSPLTHGCNGLNLLESEMLTKDDHLDITLTYSVSPLISWAGFRRFRMINRYYAHRWNGYDVADGETEKEIVYVSENGRVWHTDRNCMHLRLSVRQVSNKEVSEERNGSGECYAACERCFDEDMKDVLFIAKEGNRYHSRQDCSGLKRSVYAIQKKEAEEKGYRICNCCKENEG